MVSHWSAITRAPILTQIDANTTQLASLDGSRGFEVLGQFVTAHMAKIGARVIAGQ